MPPTADADAIPFLTLLNTGVCGAMLVLCLYTLKTVAKRYDELMSARVADAQAQAAHREQLAERYHALAAEAVAILRDLAREEPDAHRRPEDQAHRSR